MVIFSAKKSNPSGIRLSSSFSSASALPLRLRAEKSARILVHSSKEIAKISGENPAALLRILPNMVLRLSRFMVCSALKLDSKAKIAWLSLAATGCEPASKALSAPARLSIISPQAFCSLVRLLRARLGFSTAYSRMALTLLRSAR